MFKALLIADDDQVRKLGSGLSEKGFVCPIASDAEQAAEKLGEPGLDLVLIAVNGLPPHSGLWRLPQRLKQERNLPVIALLSRGSLGSLDDTPGIDDFVIEPWDATEVAVRARRVLSRRNGMDSKGLIRCGDLTIDLARCEVAVAVRPVDLTFREYELLRFLASNRGRVFTREALLNQIWGYDYYGGDRTVDVHVRRLRSKLDDSSHAFIETVRNIGYRFSDDF